MLNTIGVTEMQYRKARDGAREGKSDKGKGMPRGKRRYGKKGVKGKIASRN